ncbi:MAG: DNA-binding domain-containing protein [archaeon]|nr:DNA-binding domain-containing protein [archaeon]
MKIDSSSLNNLKPIKNCMIWYNPPKETKSSSLKEKDEPQQKSLFIGMEHSTPHFLTDIDYEGLSPMYGKNYSMEQGECLMPKPMGYYKDNSLNDGTFSNKEEDFENIPGSPKRKFSEPLFGIMDTYRRNDFSDNSSYEPNYKVSDKIFNEEIGKVFNFIGYKTNQLNSFENQSISPSPLIERHKPKEKTIPSSPKNKKNSLTVKEMSVKSMSYEKTKSKNNLTVRKSKEFCDEILPPEIMKKYKKHRKTLSAFGSFLCPVVEEKKPKFRCFKVRSSSKNKTFLKKKRILKWDLENYTKERTIKIPKRKGNNSSPFSFKPRVKKDEVLCRINVPQENTIFLIYKVKNKELFKEYQERKDALVKNNDCPIRIDLKMTKDIFLKNCSKMLDNANIEYNEEEMEQSRKMMEKVSVDDLSLLDEIPLIKSAMDIISNSLIRKNKEGKFHQRDSNYRMMDSESKQFCVELNIQKNIPLSVVSLLCEISLKNLKRWRIGGFIRKKGCGRKIKDPIMEQKLLEWYNEATRQHIYPTSKMIRAKALELTSDKTFIASKGWLEKFKSKYNLKVFKKNHLKFIEFKCK